MAKESKVDLCERKVRNARRRQAEKIWREKEKVWARLQYTKPTKRELMTGWTVFKGSDILIYNPCIIDKITTVIGLTNLDE